MTTAAGTAVMWPPAWERLEPPKEAGELSPGAFG